MVPPVRTASAAIKAMSPVVEVQTRRLRWVAASHRVKTARELHHASGAQWFTRSAQRGWRPRAVVPSRIAVMAYTPNVRAKNPTAWP
jgi:hypothetical protein